MRVLLVIHRFGPGVVGGAESLARAWAEALAPGHDVTVATTCARDYLTWEDAFAPGEERVAVAPGASSPAAGAPPVASYRLRRFRVPRPRSMARFNALSRLAFRVPASGLVARWWMRAQGPVSPTLAAWLARQGSGFDVVLLFNYLYHTTWCALPHVAPRALLVPLAHDEAPLALRAYGQVFAAPRAIATMSATEERLLRARFGGLIRAPLVRVGAAVALPPEAEPAQERRALEAWLDSVAPEVRRAVASGRYALVLSRLTPAKDVDALARDVAEVARAAPPGEVPTVVMAGPLEMDERVLVRSPLLALAPGAVAPEAAAALRRRALATLHASRHESLNLAALESLAAGVPVVAHARSEATVEIVAASGAGRTWATPSELRPALAGLAALPEAGRADLAALARRHVAAHHAAGGVLASLEEAMAAVVRAAPAPPVRP